jgi:ATP-binding cassette, subfamily B, bacterial
MAIPRVAMRRFPLLLQKDSMDCGPACLAMIGRYHGADLPVERWRDLAGQSREGVSIQGLAAAGERSGYCTRAVKLNVEELHAALENPCILHWQRNHFVVLFRIKNNVFHIADPARGICRCPAAEFARAWMNDGHSGIALFLTPQPEIFHVAKDARREPRITRYLLPYRWRVLQLFAGLLLGSLIQLVIPFFTQRVVDVGIRSRDLEFVSLALTGQFVLSLARISIDIIRARILFHIGSGINMNILAEFIARLLQLPIGYFDTRKTGDILQRVNDHHRIQHFLTGTSLSTLFALFNLLVFSIVLAMYSGRIFAVFGVCTSLYIGWITIFLRRRRSLDQRGFRVASAEQDKIIQLVQGMQEIKLYGCERVREMEWKQLQATGYEIGGKALSLNQWQQAGAFFINEGKNIFITFLAAAAVIHGQMTLGGLLAIQYTTSLLNGPIEQLIEFVQAWQMARISLDRLNEIRQLPLEEDESKDALDLLPHCRALTLKNVSFHYPGGRPVLQDINMVIPAGRITAIVGASGSGKTSLLRLILKILIATKGRIDVGGVDLRYLSTRKWREQIGVVMQESFIFSDTIAANIAIGMEKIDMARLRQAAETANILEFIERLPAGFDTRIGAEGMSLSTGQKQRLFIARVVYRDPAYVFFDEATNNLDASNENSIMNNLAGFFRNKTVVIIAHRLSTIRQADQIVLLDGGRITEMGTHEELISLRGNYYKLIKDQLT